MSGEDLVLYQKLYNIMYKQITEKNRSYVVKSIINTSDALLPDTESNSCAERTTSSSKTKDSSIKATSNSTLQETNKKASLVLALID